MRIEWRKPQGFRLGAASEFYSGFVPGSGMAAARMDDLTLAFRLDGSYAPVVVRLEERGDAIVGHVAGANDATVIAKQVGRILGLEAGAEEWIDLGKRDALIGKLQAEFPGFFTAAKSSPYDAATWAVICPRMNFAQAARVKIGIAKELGETLTLEGREFAVFPSPSALAQLESFPGLAAEKVARLRAVAEAAKTGKLDADRLRSMSPDEALAELQKIRGVGAWAAGHIYFRGAAPSDGFPTTEPRVLRAFAEATGASDPTMDDFERAAEQWRPFRMWTSILLVRHLARAGKWSAARKRAS